MIQNVNINSPGPSGGRGIFVDFAWETANEPEEISTDPENPTQVGQVALYGLQPGDEIWLNGLFHANGDITRFSTIRVQILKNGTAIYDVDIDIDAEAHDDQTTVPVQTVDTQSSAGSVAYTLIVGAYAGSSVILQGPRTFTAAVIRR